MLSNLNLSELAIAPLNSLQQFNLSDIGINQDHFLSDISTSFDTLSLDIYEKKRQQVLYLKNKFPNHQAILNKFLPDYFRSKSSLHEMNTLLSVLTAREVVELEQLGEMRHRAIGKFEVVLNRETLPQIKRVSAGAFIQNTSVDSDLRALPRFFTEISEQLANHISFRQLCRHIAVMVKNLNPRARRLTLTVHQVSVCVERNQPFHLPEGIHQDGVDYIVSAIPIILQNVIAPVSTVYDLNEKPIYTTTLKVGEGLFHDDKIYKHSVSALHTKADYGKRCTLGFDIELS